jgi:hypothetical protein
MNAAAIQQHSLEHLEDKYPGTAINWGELKGVAGKEHYKLVSYLSSLYKGRNIFDIGTHQGASALAIASGSETNHVYSFDLKHIYPLPSIPNVSYHTDDLMSDVERVKWEEKLLGSAFILLDIDSNNGCQEYVFYLWLKEKNYMGFIICDDIWNLKRMRDNFWFKIPAAEKVDVTSMGHCSGTGIVRLTPSELWPAIHIPENWTVVTAYFDLTKMSDASKSIKDRPSTHYLENARATMSTEQNLVVFCEEESVELLREMRPSWLQQKTKYIPMSFEDFPMTQYRAKIQENRRQKPYAFDDRNTASYYLLCMSRYAMLKRIIEENPFQSTHFAWLNICIERMGWKNVMALDDVWRHKRDKFSTCYIDYQPEALVKNTAEYYKWGRCSLCSGFFTGSAYYMKTFCNSIEEEFLKMLQLGYGHADEQLFSLVFFKHRDIFEVYYGDYQEMIVNYIEPRERPSEPLRLLIARSFAARDYDVCEKGCAAVWAAFKKGVAILSMPELDRLMQIYRTTLEKQGKGNALP